MDTWMQSLRQKFRDARRPMVNNDKVIAMKRKYGFSKANQASSSSTSSEIETPMAAKRASKENSHDHSMEDSASLELHIKVMQNEMKKKKKDHRIINDRMLRTYKSRRDEIRGGIPFEDLIEKYPAFKLSEVMLSEMERIVNKNILENLEKVDWQNLKKLLTKNMEHFEISCEDHDDILLNLPLLFKEKRENFVTTEDVKTFYPTLQISEEQLHIVVHKKKICSTRDVVEGVAALVAAYWAFDIALLPHLKNTLFFLGYLCGLDSIMDAGKRPVAVQRLINKL